MPRRELVPLRQALGDILPAEWLAPVGAFLDVVALDVAYSHTRWDHVGFSTAHRFYILAKARLDLPLVPGMALEIGEAGGYPSFVVRVVTSPVFEFGVEELPITLWLPPAMVRPHTYTTDDGWLPALTDAGETLEGFPITVIGGITANERGDVNLAEGTRVEVPFGAMIGETGLVLDLRSGGDEPPIELLLGDVPGSLADSPDVPDEIKEALDGFKGIYIRRLVAQYVAPGSRIPPLSLAHAAIGSGGFYGTVAIGLPENADTEIAEARLEELRLDPAGARRAGLVHGELQGMVTILQYFGVTFTQSIPSSSRVAGYVYIAFGERWVRFEAELAGPTGELLIALGGTDERPLFDLDTEWLEVRADELRYFLDDDVHWVGVKGSARPKIGGIDWPLFKVDELRVSSDGDVEVDGGWIELPQQQVIDLGGFQVEISALGFGRDEQVAPEGGELPAEASHRSWVGFSGGISLVEGIPLSASVEGLKVSWNPGLSGGDVQVSLEGVALSLEIPGTLKLAGKVAYKRLEGTPADGGLTGEIFLGAVDLDLICLRTEVEAQLVIGRLTDTEGHTFDVAYVLIAADFPAPVPLGATGAGLYGLKGLVGINIAPDRHPVDGEEEAWFEWYKAARGEAPAYSITHIDKWAPRRAAYAFGAGLSVGTVYDDGFTLNVAATVVVLLPGPVVLIEGKGNLLSERGDDGQGAFYALAVFDGLAGTFAFNLDIAYDVAGIVGVTGSVEAFFDFHDTTAWHVWLGQKEPESKRIGAEILTIFRASMYLMLDHHGFVTGAKAGLEMHESWGPVSADLVALVQFEAAIFWNPVQLAGFLEMAVQLALKICGIGIELLLRVLLAASTPNPFRVHGEAQVALKLPFPLPSFDVTVEFTWEEPSGPPLPVAPFLTGASMMHHLSAQSWEMAASREAAALATVPVDAVPLLSFGRPLAGRTLVQRPDGTFEYHAGDAVSGRTFRYAVERIVVLGDPGGDGEYEVARYPVTDDLTQTPLDFAEDSLLPGPTAQEPKWRLWRQGGRPGTTYSREVPDPRAPACGANATTPLRCVDFRGLADGAPFPALFTWRGLGFRAGGQPWVRGATLRVADLWIELPVPAGEVRLVVEGTAHVTAYRHGEPVEVATPTGPAPRRNYTIVDRALAANPDTATGIDAVHIREIALTSAPGVGLVSVCTRSLAAMVSEARDRGARESDGVGRTPNSLLLRPETTYRVEIDLATRTTVGDSDPSEATIGHTLWFRTGNGPGTNNDRATFQGSPLDTLERYVEQTVPVAGDSFGYAGLDVRVLFTEPYVPALYREGEELGIVVRDRNGNQIGVSEALTVAPWLECFGPELWTSLAQREADGCGSRGHEPGIHPGEGIGELVWPTGGHLRPGRAYTAEVVATYDGQRAVLHRFGFAVGRYRTPEDLVRSGLREEVAGEARQPVLTLPLAGALSGDLVHAAREPADRLSVARVQLSAARARGELLSILDARAACAQARTELAANSSGRFADLASALGIDLAGRATALGFELSAIPSGGGVVLLLEIPEPLDLSRWLLRYAAGDGVHTLTAVANRDGTRAFLLPATGSAALSPNGDTLELLHLWEVFPELVPLTVAGTAYTAAVTMPLAW